MTGQDESLIPVRGLYMRKATAIVMLITAATVMAGASSAIAINIGHIEPSKATPQLDLVAPSLIEPEAAEDPEVEQLTVTASSTRIVMGLNGEFVEIPDVPLTPRMLWPGCYETPQRTDPWIYREDGLLLEGYRCVPLPVPGEWTVEGWGPWPRPIG